MIRDGRAPRRLVFHTWGADGLAVVLTRKWSLGVGWEVELIWRGNDMVHSINTLDGVWGHQRVCAV